MTLPDTTEAAVLFETGQPLRIVSLGLPPLREGQVLVELAFSGVCHTQVLEADGKRGPDRFLPHTLGHEGSGTVLGTGPGVSKVKLGERVVLSWIRGSGANAAPAAYAGPDGKVNSGQISTFMRHAVVSENRLTPIPEGMPLREGALLGCALLTGAGIAFNAAEVQAGQSVGVFGCGGIGLSAILGAKLRGAGMIVAVDVIEEKLRMARDAGATHIINARTADPVEAVLALLSRGLDCAIEAAGRSETMEAAFRSVREGGGLCVLAGNLPHGGRISIDPMDLIKGKRIVGTWGGESRPDRDIPFFAEEFIAGRLKLWPLALRDYALKDVNQAMSDLKAGQVGRALISLAAA